MRTGWTALLLLSAIAVSGSTVSAGEREVSCWRASIFDHDGDGYARRYADKDDRSTFDTSDSLALTCPAGWVKARGDCNDNDASIHPRRHEIYGNDVDDNCDGRKDEPTFTYAPDGFQTTPTSFTLVVRVHDADVLAAFQSPQYELAYQLEYARLADTSAVQTTGYQTVAAAYTTSGFVTINAELTGLVPEFVYRVRVQFYQKRKPLVIRTFSTMTTSTKTSFTASPDYTTKTYEPMYPSYSTYLPIGEQSGWYYTATSSDFELGRTRTAMVRRALYESYLSSFGYSGYRGYASADGTRYGADMGERWCSEFYSWVASRHLAGMGHRSHVGAVKSYFTSRGAWYTLSDADDVSNALPGDYIGMDTSGDDKKNHSAMFLAYDLATDTLWTVDGNTSGRTDIGDGYDSRRAGNETFVRERSPDVALGRGRIRYEMIRR